MSRIHDTLLEGCACVWVVFLPCKSLEIAYETLNFRRCALRGDPKNSKVHPPLVDRVEWSFKSSMEGLPFTRGEGVQSDVRIT